MREYTVTPKRVEKRIGNIMRNNGLDPAYSLVDAYSFSVNRRIEAILIEFGKDVDSAGAVTLSYTVGERDYDSVWVDGPSLALFAHNRNGRGEFEITFKPRHVSYFAKAEKAVREIEAYLKGMTETTEKSGCRLLRKTVRN